MDISIKLKLQTLDWQDFIRNCVNEPESMYNYIDPTGNNILHYLTKIKIIQTYCTKTPYIKNKFGETPLDISISNRNIFLTDFWYKVEPNREKILRSEIKKILSTFETQNYKQETFSKKN